MVEPQGPESFSLSSARSVPVPKDLLEMLLILLLRFPKGRALAAITFLAKHTPSD